jgi:hypothetical protein
VTVSAALLLAFAAAAAPRTAVVVHATGFPDADVRRLEEKTAAEVTAAGAELWTLSKALEIKSECLEDRSCARDVLRAADATFLVWVELLRAGSQVQLSSHLLDAEGRVVAEVESRTRAEAVLGASPLLPNDVLAPLRSAAASGSSTSAASGSDGGARSSAGGAGDAGTKSGAAPGDPTEPTEEQPLTPLAIGGIAALGAGTLLALGGTAVIPGQVGIARDPASLGSEKEAAATVASVAFLVAVLGGITAVTGGVLLALGLPP